jgi:hypothetical protein
MQSSPDSRPFFSLRSIFLLSSLVSNILNLCYFLSVRDQVLHPYKTAGKIVVLCILIRKFLGRRLEDNCTEL